MAKTTSRYLTGFIKTDNFLTRLIYCQRAIYSECTA